MGPPGVTGPTGQIGPTGQGATTNLSEMQTSCCISGVSGQIFFAQCNYVYESDCQLKDINNNLFWAKQGISTGFGYTGLGSCLAIGKHITTDSQGYVYACGYFRGTISFGDYDLVAPKDGIYVVKLDRAGSSVIWANSIIGRFEEYFPISCVAHDNNLFIAGTIYQDETYIFNPIAFNKSGSSTISFVANIDTSTGNFTYINSVVGGISTMSTGLSSDPSGNVYLSGVYVTSTNTKTCSFYSGDNLDITLNDPNSSNTRFYLAKMNTNWILANGALSSGNLVFPTQEFNTYGIFSDQNYTYIGAQFMDDIQFVGNPLYSGSGVFLNRFDNATGIWDTPLFCSGDADVRGIAVDSGNVYMVGNINSSIFIDKKITPANTNAFYVAICDTDLTGWTNSVYVENAVVNDICIGDSLFITGNYVSNTLFGTIQLKKSDPNSIRDIFVGYINKDALLDFTNVYGFGYDYGNNNSIGICISESDCSLYITGKHKSITLGKYTLKSPLNYSAFVAQLCQEPIHIPDESRYCVVLLEDKPFGKNTVKVGLPVSHIGGYTLQPGCLYYKDDKTAFPNTNNINETVVGIAKDANTLIFNPTLDDHQPISCILNVPPCMTGSTGQVFWANDGYIYKNSNHLININANIIWATTIGTTIDSKTTGIASDIDGNVYSVGVFTGDINFPSGVTGSVGQDIFVVKHDMDGNFIWGKKIGVSNTDMPNYPSITTAGGNIYVSGLYLTELIPTGMTGNSQAQNIFIISIDLNGNINWQIKAVLQNDIDTDILTCFEITATSTHVYCSGYISSGGGCDFYNLNVDISLPGPITAYFFVACVDTAALVPNRWLWVSVAETQIIKAPYMSLCHNNSDIYVSGIYNSNILFVNSSVLGTSNVSKNIFVAKLNQSGVWISEIDGIVTGDTNVSSICADDHADVYVAGTSNGLLSLGTEFIDMTGINLSSFILKTNMTEMINGKKIEGLSEIKMGCAGMLYFCGNFQVQITMDDTKITPKGTSDIIVGGLDMVMTTQWYRTYGTTGFANNTYCIHAADYLYFGGGMNYIDFGTYHLVANNQLFIAKSCRDAVSVLDTGKYPVILLEGITDGYRVKVALPNSIVKSPGLKTGSLYYFNDIDNVLTGDRGDGFTVLGIAKNCELFLFDPCICEQDIKDECPIKYITAVGQTAGKKGDVYHGYRNVAYRSILDVPQEYVWSNSVNSSSFTNTTQVPNCNYNGYVYLTGPFNSDSIIDSFGVSGPDVNNSRKSFVTKIDAQTGSAQWITKIYGDTGSGVLMHDIFADADGIYVYGHALGTTGIYFGEGPDLVLPCDPLSCVFIAKINTGGVWQNGIQTLGTTGGSLNLNLASRGMTFDKNDIYIIGNYYNSINFGATPALSLVSGIVGTTRPAFFVAKTDKALSMWKWAITTVHTAVSITGAFGYNLVLSNNSTHLYVLGVVINIVSFAGLVVPKFWTSVMAADINPNTGSGINITSSCSTPPVFDPSYNSLCMTIDNYDNLYTSCQMSGFIEFNGVNINQTVFNRGVIVKFDDSLVCTRMSLIPDFINGPSNMMYNIRDGLIYLTGFYELYLTYGELYMLSKYTFSYYVIVINNLLEVKLGYSIPTTYSSVSTPFPYTSFMSIDCEYIYISGNISFDLVELGDNVIDGAGQTNNIFITKIRNFNMLYPVILLEDQLGSTVKITTEGGIRGVHVYDSLQDGYVYYLDGNMISTKVSSKKIGISCGTDVLMFLPEPRYYLNMFDESCPGYVVLLQQKKLEKNDGSSGRGFAQKAQNAHYTYYAYSNSILNVVGGNDEILIFDGNMIGGSDQIYVSDNGEIIFTHEGMYMIDADVIFEDVDNVDNVGGKKYAYIELNKNIKTNKITKSWTENNFKLTATIFLEMFSSVKIMVGHTANCTLRVGCISDIDCVPHLSIIKLS